MIQILATPDSDILRVSIKTMLYTPFHTSLLLITIPEATVNGNTGFTLSQDTRNRLSSILIVHPVAAFMTLVCSVLAGASHFRGPSHSPRFLLALLILTFPTLLITLLAFLVDILLFIPNLAWGGWIVLAATLIITACSVLTCAMRRTLVSRKARKRRIAENNDMNGENFYAMKQAQSFAQAESPPPATAEPTAVNKFAVFDHSNGRANDDDRTPLNAQAPSIRTLSSGDGPSSSQPNGTPSAGNTNLSGTTAVIAAVEPAITPRPYRENSSRSTPNGTFGPSENERLRDSQRQADRQRRGVYPPYRGGPPPRGGRGGPPMYPPGRGGGPMPRGGFRGGYGPGPQGYPQRGSFGPGSGPRGGSPGGWNSRGRGMSGRGGRGASYNPGPYGSRSPPTRPRENEIRGVPPGRAAPAVIYDPTYVPNTWNTSAQRVPQTPNQEIEKGQQDDDAAAVIDAYATRRSEEPANDSFARDPSSFGFSGRQSPARSARVAPGISLDVPPVPSHNVSELDTREAAELESAPMTGVPGVVSELDSHETMPPGPG